MWSVLNRKRYFNSVLFLPRRALTHAKFAASVQADKIELNFNFLCLQCALGRELQSCRGMLSPRKRGLRSVRKYIVETCLSKVNIQ